MFGSGIGLNLVQYVVKLHFGKIWLESTPGQGTTFFIRLQLGKEHYANSNVIYTDQAITHTLKVEKNSVLSVEPEYHQQIPEDSDNRLRILVVEDDEDMRQYIVSKLSKTYNVQEAPEGKSAINIAREQIPDLIISDIMMPVMDGLELCRVIKNDMALAHIPVVLLTAKSLEEHVKDGYQALADDYILKPFNAQILLAKNRKPHQKQRKTERLVLPEVREDRSSGRGNHSRGPTHAKTGRINYRKCTGSGIIHGSSI